MKQQQPTRPDFPTLEEEVLQRWKNQRIFARTLEQTADGPRFVFFEGPPTANGKPGIHHVLARAFKDVLPRYKTMQGHYVERRAGWDTHGLPVELEVEKKLGLKSKKEIEAYGIERFNAACKESVWTYKAEWEKLTERIGFWLDLEHPYITYDPNYMESLWWIIQRIHERGLLTKGHKVVPHCPRCGTALSSHEVAQGYRTVPDTSVYVKFEIRNPKSQTSSKSEIPNPKHSPQGDGKTYILAWTTTPWTLPGNVALAVGRDITYVQLRLVRKGVEEQVILAKDRVEATFRETVFEGIDFARVLQGNGIGSTGGDAIDNYQVELIGEFKGSELVGQEYKPLFDFLDLEKLSGKKAYSIADADFVTTADGTGVVHTAVMYGEDDYKLGQQLDLPMYHTVSEAGHFTKDVGPFAGMFVKDPATEKAILQYLNEHKLLFREEPYEHEYPFCWRCDTPLLYYAKDSWFIRMSQLRDELLKNNEQITWVPEHIKEGRFGEWLREVKDWAFSRERYWGTPLPVWQCTDCKEQKVIGGIAELEQHGRPRNRYLLLRHGEAANNVAGILNSDVTNHDFHLTEKGKLDVAATAQRLQDEHVDLILASPVLRAQETAALVSETLGLPVHTEERLAEIALGQFEGKQFDAFQHYFHSQSERFERPIAGGESLNDIRRRVVALLKELEREHEGKTILLVSHGDPLWMLSSTFRQLSEEDMLAAPYPEKGQYTELTLPNYPYDSLGRVDLHRPYVDDVRLTCPACSGTMQRVKELCDVWFDSGSMPFAQQHYPFEHAAAIDEGLQYPADYISEAVDQTRGWFYTLLAVSTLLGKGPSYRHVINLGHILDDEGKKMSKHIGNVVDPWAIINAHGADALRFHLFTVNQPGEPKLFSEGDVAAVVRKTFLILWNVLSFWELTKDQPVSSIVSKHVVDRWALARTDQLVRDVSAQLDAYQVTNAARLLTDFVTELSTWYVRRSRDRLRGVGEEAAQARGTFRRILLTLTTVFAPFTPLFADVLYRRLGGTQDSVHLEGWPSTGEVNEKLLRDMDVVRKVVEAGHSLRAAAGIKVRQPLPQLVVAGAVVTPELATLLAEELNVREVVPAPKLPTGVDWKTTSAGALQIALDTTITDELRHAGWAREVIRNTNELRKRAALQPSDTITLHVVTDDEEARTVVEHYREGIATESRAASLLATAPENPLQEMQFSLGSAIVKLYLTR